MYYAQFEVNSIADKNGSLPAKILLAPKRTGARALISHKSRDIACEEHSVHNATVEISSERKVLIHVQRICITAQPCKTLYIFSSNCPIAVGLVARLNLIEISKIDHR